MFHPQVHREHPKYAFTRECVEPHHRDHGHEDEPSDPCLQSISRQHAEHENELHPPRRRPEYRPKLPGSKPQRKIFQPWPRTHDIRREMRTLPEICRRPRIAEKRVSSVEMHESDEYECGGEKPPDAAVHVGPREKEERDEHCLRIENPEFELIVRRKIDVQLHEE